MRSNKILSAKAADFGSCVLTAEDISQRDLLADCVQPITTGAWIQVMARTWELLRQLPQIWVPPWPQPSVACNAWGGGGCTPHGRGGAAEEQGNADVANRGHVRLPRLECCSPKKVSTQPWLRMAVFMDFKRWVLGKLSCAAPLRRGSGLRAGPARRPRPPSERDWRA